jgi:hypothetical protein
VKVKVKVKAYSTGHETGGLFEVLDPITNHGGDWDLLCGPGSLRTVTGPAGNGIRWNGGVSCVAWCFRVQPLISSVSDGKENVLSTVSGLIAMDDSVTQSTRFCKQANAWKFEVLPCSIMQCETSLRIVTVLPVPWLYDTNSFGYLYE